MDSRKRLDPAGDIIPHVHQIAIVLGHGGAPWPKALSFRTRVRSALFLQRRGPQHARFLSFRVMGWRARVARRNPLRLLSGVARLAAQ
jgi:hypothetical protein